MEIRPANLADAEAIRTIYNTEVLSTTVTFDLVERSEEEQRAWIEEHQGVYPAVVAVVDGEVAGFASLSPYRPRPAYSTTAEDSVYVAAAFRGQGVGSALLQSIVELAKAHGFHAIMARIVGDHEVSIALHQRCGFGLVGIEREVGRKFGRWLDVALMQRMVDDPYPEPTGTRSGMR
jgi:phosphinothricin acetyltransferase